MTINAFSQEEISNNEDISIRTNEIKLNALYLVIGAFDLTYEHLLNDESGLGVDVFIPFDEDIYESINYYVSPYYRLYFGKKYAAGFFLEGFGMLNSYDEETINFISDDNFVRENNTEVNFALGIGLGGKWVTDSGFVGELNLGVGRNLINSELEEFDFVFKVGITIGYRF